MSANIEYTLLRCGKFVPTSLYKSLLAHVLTRVDVLEPCRPFKLSKICGHQYWSGLRGYKHYAGMIMAELVDLKLVPYLFASDRHEKPLWYWLAP